MPSLVTLEETHDRKSFDCGTPALNDFLLQRGMGKYSGTTRVLAPDSSSTEIMAYFTIAPDPIAVLAGEFGATHLLSRLVELRYLAVDKRHQRQGIGEELLLEIMTEVVAVPDVYQIEALVLEPLDHEAEQWFLKRDFGFKVTWIPDRKLILFVESMRPALEGRS